MWNLNPLKLQQLELTAQAQKVINFFILPGEDRFKRSRINDMEGSEI